MTIVSQTLAGLLAGLLTPVHLRSAELSRLMAPPSARRRPGAHPGHAVRVALAAVRWLARLHLPFYRNTCLYRSVAECLVLRHYGFPVVVRIGIRGGESPSEPIAAHAWIEGMADPGPEASGFEVLRATMPGSGQ